MKIIAPTNGMARKLRLPSLHKKGKYADMYIQSAMNDTHIPNPIRIKPTQ
jgi:hypothetical protein